MNKRILVLDDNKLLLGFMEEHLTSNNYETHSFESPSNALSFLKNNNVDLVISDVKMNEMTGDEVMNHVIRHYPETGVILITGFGNINHSVNAIRKGAFDYVTKPFTSHEFLNRVNRYFNSKPNEVANGNKQHASEQSLSSAKYVKEPVSIHQETAGVGKIKMVGKHPHIKRLMAVLPRIAQSNAPIMIQGESGTGKEVFAHLIHHRSKRANGPYIKINCANLPSELVESTLFGHVKGAFTGAISDRKGAFDEAGGGTLLLDEITEIDISLQAKLLRVLQEKEFQRVGSQKPIKADVRVIATSNRDLSQAINENTFREDLYYRLNVFPITIPPLRERKEDIPLLAQHFLNRYTSQYDLESKKLTKELEHYLNEQTWKGNVRELDNKIHRGVILAQDNQEITIDDVEDVLFSNVDEKLKSEVLSDLPLITIDEMELQMIKKALEHTRGNQKQAAKLLGISDRTIRNKLKNTRWDETCNN
ncbi:MAG: sigma-54 dependent transcriptional regulator [Balneolales bacterium]